MKGKSPFDFDISVTADKKRRARARGMSGAVETSSRGCEHPGCDKQGKYRAPKSPDNLDEFLWFCLEHVRAYNLKWNFFENHSEAELERQFAADKVWERPTKPFKKGTDGHPEGRAWQRFGFDDPFEVLGDKGTVNGGAQAAAINEERIVRVVEGFGGSILREWHFRGLPSGGSGEGPVSEGPMRIQLPADSAEPFLSELRKLGTIPPEEMQAKRDLPAGPSPDVVAYTVRIRVR